MILKISCFSFRNGIVSHGRTASLKYSQCNQNLRTFNVLHQAISKFLLYPSKSVYDPYCITNKLLFPMWGTGSFSSTIFTEVLCDSHLLYAYHSLSSMTRFSNSWIGLKCCCSPFLALQFSSRTLAEFLSHFKCLLMLVYSTLISTKWGANGYV